MKRSLWCLLAFLCCAGREGFAICSSTSLGNGFICIQEVLCSGASTCNWGSNLGSGHAAFLLLGANYSGTAGWAPTATNNTYVAAIGSVTVGGSQETGIYYTCNTVAGAETVTPTPNGTLSFIQYVMVEISGNATSNCLEAITGNNSNTCTTAVTSCATGSFTSSASDLLIANGLAGSGSATAGTGFTLFPSTEVHFPAEEGLGTGATDTASIGGASASNWTIGGVALKASGGGSPPTGFNKRRKLEKLEGSH